MAKFRLQFTKHGDMKYVSHLDMIRLFTRMFHRAELPIAFSEGFNPHPKMSVLLPLSVGYESDCEYLDAEFENEVSMLDCIKKLKGAVPLGMEIPQITCLNETSFKAKEIRYASYNFTVDVKITPEQIENFFALPEIIVVKKTKRSEGEADIKPDIMDIYATGENTFAAIISAGSNANLKPDLLVSAMTKYIDGFNPKEVNICRTGILTERGEKMM
ncbi:MAG: TIGR03936 family radical SAM-associated protein [Clostridia bacterium]|nr:TIGR03936 family radical SAM-associated protein [Clostridia bacterium]